MLLATSPISPFLFGWRPICIRGIVRKEVSHQGCSWEEDESSKRLLISSLHFTMLWRLVSLFPFSLSPPLFGGKRAVLSEVILLFLTFVVCKSSRFMRFWLLETWRSSLTLVDFLTLAGTSWLLQTSWFCGLPDYTWSCSFICFLQSSGTVVFQTLKAVISILETLYFQRREYS